MQSVLNEGDFFDAFYTVFNQVGKMNKARNNANKDPKKAYYLGGSISKYTKGLTMSFPVLIDDSLSLETAQIISKANEKNISSMLQMLFASMSINGNKGITGKDVIAMFHKNIDSMPMDDYIDYANSYVNNYNMRAEAACLPVVTEAMVRDAAREMVYELKTPKKSFPVSSFNEKSLNGYMTRNGYNGDIIVYEARGSINQINPNSINIYDPTMDVSDKEKFNHQKDEEERNYQYRKQKDSDDYKYREEKDRENKNYQYNQDRLDSRQQYASNLNQHRILDSDFKKANELQPTMLIINFNVLDSEGDEPVIVDRKSFVAGIKCRMIATTALDIAERLISTNKTKISFKNLIRATTGEIEFKRDFLFAINQQKLDAKNDVKKGEAAKLWSTLKKRSVNNNYRKATRDGNDATAITTLVVSQDTVNYMKNANNFDVSAPSNAKMIMDTYNLLCLVIADEANEVARFLYDGNSEFESVAYTALTRQAKERDVATTLNMINSR